MPPLRLDRALASILGALRRFPMPLAAAAVGVGAVVVEAPDDRWLIVAALALPVFVGSTLWGERVDASQLKRTAVALLPLPLLVLYFLSLPSEGFEVVEGIRYTLLYTASMLLMLASPFLPPRTTAAFHRFSIVFVLRGLATALFTALLFGGLALALAAIEKLFGVDVASQTYGKLFAVLAGFVGVPYLLAGIPQDHDIAQSDVPVGLRVLTRYVLLPILAVYALILYAHALQQAVTWEWSEGWVARLTIGYATSGLLTVAILWPLRHDADKRWIREFTRWFAILLPPLAILLFLAVIRRADDYGMTESRYYGLVLGVWLAGVALYLLVGRRDDLRAVALSLAVIALGTAYGPWSAVNASVMSQSARLETTLEAAGALKGGHIAVPPPLIDDADGSVRSMVDFLAERNALGNLRTWFPHTSDTINQRVVMIALGLQDEEEAPKGVAPWDGSRYLTIHGRARPVARVTGYDVLAPFSSDTRPFSLADSAWVAGYRDGRVLVYRSGLAIVSVDVHARLRQIIARHSPDETDGVADTSEDPPGNTILASDEELVVEGVDSTTGCTLRVMIDEATAAVGGERVLVESVSGRMLVRFGP